MFVALFLAFAEPPKITIGKETTYITEPLRADGIVDYLGAANAKLATIDPKDNAAVLLVQAFGPEVLPKNGSQNTFGCFAVPSLPRVKSVSTTSNN
jgi:hypothetical protein